MKLTLNGKEYDLSKAMPVTIGDLKQLKQKFGFTDTDLAKGDVVAVSALLMLLLQKQDKELTEELFNALPLVEAEAAFQYIAAQTTRRPLDRPT